MIYNVIQPIRVHIKAKLNKNTMDLFDNHNVVILRYIFSLRHTGLATPFGGIDLC